METRATDSGTQVTLVPLLPEMSGWWAAGPGAFEDRTGLCAGEASSWMGSVLAMTRAPDHPGPGGGWHGFWGVESGQVIGTCAYAARPDGEGRVEVAYFVFPPFEGRGLGRKMAGRLVTRAAADGRWPLMAKTVAEENASTRILRGLGFQRAGEAEDPEQGTVWVWVLAGETGLRGSG